MTYAEDIGELTDDEVAYFEKKTHISDKRNFVLQDICSFDTIEKRTELIKATKEYKYIPYGLFIEGVEFGYAYTDEKREAAVFLSYCGQEADNIREARILIPVLTTSSETTVPPVADVAPPLYAPPALPVNAGTPKNRTKDLYDILNDYVSKISNGKLTLPENGNEKGTWVKRTNMKADASVLRTYRSGQPKETLQDGSILGIDKVKQIYWQDDKNSKTIFYLKSTVNRPDTK